MDFVVRTVTVTPTFRSKLTCNYPTTLEVNASHVPESVLLARHSQAQPLPYNGVGIQPSGQGPEKRPHLRVDRHDLVLLDLRVVLAEHGLHRLKRLLSCRCREAPTPC